jgi:hypothetical protein
VQVLYELSVQCNPLPRRTLHIPLPKLSLLQAAPLSPVEVATQSNYLLVAVRPSVEPAKHDEISGYPGVWVA